MGLVFVECFVLFCLFLAISASHLSERIEIQIFLLSSSVSQTCVTRFTSQFLMFFIKNECENEKEVILMPLGVRRRAHALWL